MAGECKIIINNVVVGGSAGMPLRILQVMVAGWIFAGCNIFMFTFINLLQMVGS